MSSNPLSPLVFWLLGSVWFVSFESPVAGQEFDPVDYGDRLKVVLDESTIGIGHVDIEKVDVDGVSKKLAELFGIPSEPVAKVASSIKRQIKETGGRHLFLTFSMTDLPPQPVLSIPLESGKDVASLEKSVLFVLGPTYRAKYIAKSKLLVFGNEQSLKRVEAEYLPTREDCVELLKMIPDSVASIGFVPSADQRKVIREFEPQFDKPLEMINGELVATGMKSVFVSLDSIEPLQIELRANSDNTAAAKQLLETVKLLTKQIPVNRPEQIFAKQVIKEIKLDEEAAGLSLVLGENEERFWLALKPFFDNAQKEARASERVNQFKQILLAMHNYHDTFRGFPDLGRPQDKGKPGLSWRVHILPFIDEVELYRQFRLDEPWDSDHNRKLIARMPSVYQVKGSKLKDGMTPFVMPRGNGFFAQPYEIAEESEKKTDEKKIRNGRSFRDILDGTSNTIALVQVNPRNAVEWTKPQDWTPKKESVMEDLKLAGQDAITFAAADGAVHRIPWNEITAEKLLKMMTIAGGEIVDFHR